MPTLIEDSKALSKARAEAADAQTVETWMSREGAIEWLKSVGLNPRCLPKRGDFRSVQWAGSPYGRYPAMNAAIWNRGGKYQLIDASAAAEAQRRVMELEASQSQRRLKWALRLLESITLTEDEKAEVMQMIGMGERLAELELAEESLSDARGSLDKIEDTIRWHHLRCKCGGRSCETCRTLADKILPLCE